MNAATAAKKKYSGLRANKKIAVSARLPIATDFTPGE